MNTTFNCYRCGAAVTTAGRCDCRDSVTLIHGDCREVLPQLDAGAFDLVLTDPPYGLGDKWQGGGGGIKSSWNFNPDGAQAWDGATVEDVLQLPAIAKEAIVWGGNYYALPPSRCWLVWDKCQPDTWTTGQCELAWTSLDRPVRAFRMCQAVAHDEMRPKQHPTQKPESLIKWCFKWATEGASVLDPFAGSCTTGRAAKDLGRRCLLIEREEKYCQIGAQRLRQEVLFGESA